MSYREPCGNVEAKCDHEKDSHHKEYPSSGDLLNPAAHRPEYFNCLVANCTCKKWMPKGTR